MLNRDQWEDPFAAAAATAAAAAVAAVLAISGVMVGALMAVASVGGNFIKFNISKIKFFLLKHA